MAPGLKTNMLLEPHEVSTKLTQSAQSSTFDVSNFTTKCGRWSKHIIDCFSSDVFLQYIHNEALGEAK